MAKIKVKIREFIFTRANNAEHTAKINKNVMRSQGIRELAPVKF